MEKKEQWDTYALRVVEAAAKCGKAEKFLMAERAGRFDLLAFSALFAFHAITRSINPYFIASFALMNLSRSVSSRT